MTAYARLAAHAVRTPRRFVGSTGFLCALPFLALFACEGPDPRPVDELVLKGDVFLDPETLEPYSGPVFATFDDEPDVVARRARLRQGTYEGPYEAYFANARLSAKEIYRAGRRHGPYEYYFESGRLFERGSYRMGLLDGPYEAYWESGELYEQGTRRAGEFHGPRRWYLGGELIEVVTYRNGVIDGPYERYAEDGALEARGTLRDGRPCGTWLEGGRMTEYPACGAGSATD